MLDIIDINSSGKDLNQITLLKDSFKNRLTNVKTGTVIIINNFPAHEIIRYLIIINVEKKNNNYLRVRVDNNNYYVDNIICAIVEFPVNHIIDVDDNFLYDLDSNFDYLTENKHFNRGLFKFLKDFEQISCNTIFNITTDENINYSGAELLLNEKLDADSILTSVVKQQLRWKTHSSRIRSFSKEVSKKMNSKMLHSFVEDIINNTKSRFQYGILTRKKLALIAKVNNKKIGTINSHIGKTINIIKGKAGTGKTVYLAKSIYTLVSNNHRARFLTFNHALIKDIKCTLRGYGSFNLSNFSSSTIHQYFYKLTEEMGINLILSEDRVNELLDICLIRINKSKPTFDLIKNKISFSEKAVYSNLIANEKDKSNYPEFRSIAKYFMEIRDFRNWPKIKEKYLEKKRKILQRFIGSKVFLEDYSKVLETLYLSIVNPQKFYTDFNISNRYDLLSFIYEVDIQSNQKNIPLSSVKKQVQKLKQSANWSTIFIDESQDCEQYEKEILFELRGPENIVVATGGQKQLIRTSGVRLWHLSNGKKIPHNTTNLYGNSYRQKENIIEFVNAIADEYKINLKLKSHHSGKGVGKIILDIRQDFTPYDFKKINELITYGTINKCSKYESLMLLISRKYIHSKTSVSFNIDRTDYVEETRKSINKSLKDEDKLEKEGIHVWSGVSENKSKLKVPYQNQIRVIPYDSCRGLEAWSVMCLDLDGFIKRKRNSDEAKIHLSDNLFLTEEERRDRYALIWLLMAFTRPMDTLYLDLRNRSCDISKKIVAICSNLDGVEILS